MAAFSPRNAGGGALISSMRCRFAYPSQSQSLFHGKLNPFHSSIKKTPITTSSRLHFNTPFPPPPSPPPGGFTASTSSSFTSSSSSSMNFSAATSASETTVAAVDNYPLQQADLITHLPPPPLTSSEWSAFAAKVSGEWDGHGADFTVEGKPIELPESVVPEAYREWEVKVFDWQTQCPTLAQPEDFTAMYKLIKLLPTVGCEADAATRYTVDERNIGGANNSVSAFAYQSSGSYGAVWKIKDGVSYQLLELEHCLIDPQDRESRVRIIQVVHVEDHKLVLKNIRVFVEQWYGPFRNGEQLGGCAIRDSAFACTDPLKNSEVTGAWQGSSAVATFQNFDNSILQELVDDRVQKSVRDDDNLVLLPKKLWSSVKEIEDGETCFEVGWLLQQGHALTSKCIFSRNAELKEIAMAQETAALGQQ